MRLKRDSVQFHNAWNYGRHVGGNSRIRKIFTDECAMLRKWGNSMVPIFFDFGDDQNFWWAHAKGSSEQVYGAQYSRTEFIEIHRNSDTSMAVDFNRLVDEFDKFVASQLLLKAQVSRQATFQLPLSFRSKPRQRL